MNLQVLEISKKRLMPYSGDKDNMRDKSHGLHTLKPKIFFFLLFISLLFASCSAKKIELPDFEGADINDVINGFSGIEKVEAVVSVEFEKGDGTMTGDAALELSENTLNLRVYSLGFPVAELNEADGIIKSKPEISANKGFILVDGLRYGILWWLIRGYETEELDRLYELRNSWQRIGVDKKLMLPTYQIIELYDGKELKILYDAPMKTDNFWYQSRLRIELAKYVVNLKIKRIAFLPRLVQDQ